MIFPTDPSNSFQVFRALKACKRRILRPKYRNQVIRPESQARNKAMGKRAEKTRLPKPYLGSVMVRNQLSRQAKIEKNRKICMRVRRDGLKVMARNETTNVKNERRMIPLESKLWATNQDFNQIKEYSFGGANAPNWLRKNFFSMARSGTCQSGWPMAVNLIGKTAYPESNQF